MGYHKRQNELLRDQIQILQAERDEMADNIAFRDVDIEGMVWAEMRHWVFMPQEPVTCMKDALRALKVLAANGAFTKEQFVNWFFTEREDA